MCGCTIVSWKGIGRDAVCVWKWCVVHMGALQRQRTVSSTPWNGEILLPSMEYAVSHALDPPHLTQSSTGYAQMAVLVCQWLAAVQHGAAGNDPGTPRAASQPPLDEASCLRVGGLDVSARPCSWVLVRNPRL